MTARVDVINGSGVVANLDQLVQRGVEGITGLMNVPEKRGSNLVVPGSHGELHIPGKKYGAANLVSQLWVRGVNPDGSVPGGSDDGARLAFHTNLRTLVNLFTQDERVTLRHTLTDGSQREIVGEVTDALQPDIDSYGRYTNGRFAVALNCSSPFWSDLTATTQTISSTGAVTLTNFAGADTWMEDLTLTFGPQSNPRLTQASTGLFVQLGKVIAAGQGAIINTATWTVTPTGGLSSTGLYEALTYGAGPLTSRWFALRPEPGGGAPVVALTQTGGGTGTVTITGKRRYRIG